MTHDAQNRIAHYERGIFRLFRLRKFPGEKCNESNDPGVYCYDTDEWPTHAPVAMWFNGDMIC